MELGREMARSPREHEITVVLRTCLRIWVMTLVACLGSASCERIGTTPGHATPVPQAPTATAPANPSASDLRAYVTGLPARVAAIHDVNQAAGLAQAGLATVSKDSPTDFTVTLNAPVDSSTLAPLWGWTHPFAACDLSVAELKEDAGGPSDDDLVGALALPWMGEWEVSATVPPMACLDWWAEDLLATPVPISAITFTQARSSLVASLPTRIAAIPDAKIAPAALATLTQVSVYVDSPTSFILSFRAGMDAARLAALVGWSQPGDLCGQLVVGAAEKVPAFGRWQVLAQLPQGPPCKAARYTDLTKRPEAISSLRVVLP
jgi:hypothetical protein